MSWLRHASRHVHHSVADYIEGQLEALDWMDPESTPFGSPVVQVRRTSAFIGEKLDPKIEPGTVVITLGDEPDPDLEELGGPQSTQDYPIFVDIFSDTDGTTRSLASDVKDICLGRFPGSKRWLGVVDQSDDSLVENWRIELHTVLRERPEVAMPLRWEVVKVTATAHFPEVLF